ncbi:MAG: hypothetical protein V1800_13025 [Candidatus Latescibacterota bacterium]
MRTFMFSAVFALLVLCCPEEALCGRSGNDSDYFPLQIGNWWEYDVRNQRRALGTFKASVVDTTSMNGRTYFLLTGYRWFGQVFMPGYIPADTLLVRKEGAKVFFRNFDGQDILFYNFAAGEDDIWYIPADWAPESAWPVRFSVYVNWDSELSQRLTPSEGHVFIGFGGEGLTNWVEEFARGIGPVCSFFWAAEDGPRVITLRRAFINNQELSFGTTAVGQCSWGRIKWQFMEYHQE